MTVLESAQHTIQPLRAQLEAAGLAFRAPPPLPTSCCGRGCNGCVWEGYYNALGYWVEEAQALLAQPQLLRQSV